MKPPCVLDEDPEVLSASAYFTLTTKEVQVFVPFLWIKNLRR